MPRGARRYHSQLLNETNDQRRHLGACKLSSANTNESDWWPRSAWTGDVVLARGGPSWLNTLLTRWLASTLPKLGGRWWMTRSSGITSPDRSTLAKTQDTHFRPKANKSKHGQLEGTTRPMRLHWRRVALSALPWTGLAALFATRRHCPLNGPNHYSRMPRKLPAIDAIQPWSRSRVSLVFPLQSTV